SVQRENDAFITNQLRGAQNQSTGLTTRYEQMSKIDNLLADKSSSQSGSMQSFFTSLKTLVSNAEDTPARQALIGKAEGLVNQF
ncbi:flagellar hook-associated protein FlgK, partial [Salmonella enterica subsp. enterica serovar Kentucky]|uniref:FlgK family flagellar hook-associated protein n=1 Tax=Salmonella enterica TaxID=28901 RepID=UPI003F4B5805